MRSYFTIKNPSRQKGLALVILIVAIVLAYITYIVSGLSLTEVKVQREKDTLKALNKAKQSLIAFAVNYPRINANRGPGYLPCADQVNDGEGTPIGCPTAGVVNVGRFPWKTLGVGDLRDGANERLWYAVSNNFDHTGNPSTNKINTATTGSITVRDNNNNILYDGTLFDAAVAIIIAPGEALTRDDAIVQDRSTTTGDPNAAINYLDIDTSSGEDNASFQHGMLDGFIEGEIVNGAGDVIVNDRFVVITYRDIMGQVHKRVAGEIATVLNCTGYLDATEFDPDKSLMPGDYTSGVPKYGHLPVDEPAFAACLPPAWLVNENWHKEAYYHFSVGVPGCNVGVNCLTDVFTGANNIDALVVFAGREVGGQLRGDPSSDLADYFENENNIINLDYDSSEPNDHVFIMAP